LERKLPLFLLVALIAVFIFTFALTPESKLNWLLEVGPGLIGAAVCVATYRRFPLSTFVYVCIFVHVVILAYGGFYTYAKAPLGEWMKTVTGSGRNDYDKIGHFAFGFFPVFTLREIYLRLSLMKDGGWLNFTLVSIVAGFAAVYELIEWAAALVLDPAGGDAFLGTQGDIWDAQKDMAYAIVGATVGLLLLRELHQRSLLSVTSRAPTPR
jgi:putative membrane protein